jgi:hypothetical protein
VADQSTRATVPSTRGSWNGQQVAQASRSYTCSSGVEAIAMAGESALRTLFALPTRHVVCAPMVDQSELAFRMLCRKYGANVCYTPMLHSKIFLQNAHYRKSKFTTNPQDRPLVVQVCMHMYANGVLEWSCNAYTMAHFKRYVAPNSNLYCAHQPNPTVPVCLPVCLFCIDQSPLAQDLVHECLSPNTHFHIFDQPLDD